MRGKSRDGEKLGVDCPECGEELVFEMGFTDQFSYKTGHYTTDCPMKVCTKCDYSDRYEEEEEYDERI